MTRRSPARLLAPLALVAVAAALFVVVSNGSGGSGGDSPTRAGSSSTPGSATKTPAARSSRTRRRSTYRVRAGDTPSGIADRAGISVEQLLELNPDLDAQALTVGQRLKLR